MQTRVHTPNNPVCMNALLYEWTKIKTKQIYIMNMTDAITKFICSITKTHTWFAFYPLSCWIDFRKYRNLFTFFMTSLHWDGTGCWNPFSLRTRTGLYGMVNVMAATVLTMEKVKASVTMLLAEVSQNILVSASKRICTMASQITSFTIVYSTVYSDADQRKYQSSASLAFVREFTGDRWISRIKGQ